MPNLDPLKFSIGIKDEASETLNKISAALDSLNGKSVNVSVQGIDQLRQLINMLNQGGGGSNIGASLSEGLQRATAALDELRKKYDALASSESTASQQQIEDIKRQEAEIESLEKKIQRLETMKQEAPSAVAGEAILDSLEGLSAKIKSTNEALSQNNFESFTLQINQCVIAVQALQAAFEKFQITVGQDTGMRDLLTGFGEALNRVSQTVGATRTVSVSNKAVADEGKEMLAKLKSIEQAKYEAYKLDQILAKATAASATGQEFGDTSKIDALIEKVRQYREELEKLKETGSLEGKMTADLKAQGDYRIAVDGLKKATSEQEKANKTNIKAAESSREAASGVAEVTEQERRLALALTQTSDKMGGQSKLLGELKTLATQYLGVWGAHGFMDNIIKIGGQLESQRLSLTAILGQASYANDLYAKVQGLAVKSPFGVVQLDQYTKNLSAYGFQYHELFDMTKRLADIAAGTGTDFSRLALALGHVRSEMALTGYTLRQFSMANVPMLKMLAENLGVTTSEIRKMVRAKEVSYKDVENVIKELTSEGGMFFNMQETMSEAVSAKFKNLKDSMDIMYGQMAESGIGDFLKAIAAGLMQVTTHWQASAAAIGIAASMLAIYKTAQMAVNRGMAAATANMLGQAVITKKLTAEEVLNLAVKKLITAEDLVQAVATKRLSFAQAELAAETLLVDKAYLKQLASMKRVQFAMRGMGMARMGKMLANPWFLALVAIEAVVTAVIAYRSWVKDIEKDAEAFTDRMKTATKEMSDFLKDATKPTNERELVAVNEQMKGILKNAGLYTEELQHEVNLAGSLSDQYDVLLEKMDQMRNPLADSGLDAGDIADAIKRTSIDVQEGAPWIFKVPIQFSQWLSNDSLEKNVKQLQKSQNKVRRSISGIGKEELQEMVDAMLAAGVHAEMANYPLEEQLRILSEDKDAWDSFVQSSGNGSKQFYENMERLYKALKSVSKQQREIVNDDIPAIYNTLKDKFGGEEGLANFINENPEAFKMFVEGVVDAIKQGAPDITEAIRQAMLNAPDGNFAVEFVKRFKTEVEKAAEQAAQEEEAKVSAIADIGQSGKRGKALEVLNGKDSSITAAWLSGKIGYSLSKTDAELEESVMAAYKKAKTNLSAAKKFENKDEIEYWTAESKRLKLLIDYFGFTDKKNKGGEDKEAKELRERVRILKEANESYQYWRKQVGDTSAQPHVNEEFGKLLQEQGMTFEDIEKYAESLKNVRAEYQAIYDASKKAGNDRPQLLEALKEIDKILADIGRKDFEKESEEALSTMKFMLDKLTRGWEKYESVVNATGNRALASLLSGIAAGSTEAEVRRRSLSDYTGMPLDFAKVYEMSSEDIDRYVESLGLSETKIKAVQEGLKDWQKAQQDLEKSDIVNYANYLGSLVDLETVRRKNQEEYNKTLEETKRLLDAGLISPEEAAKRNRHAEVMMNTNNWQATSDYYALYNTSQQMAATEFATAYETELDNLKTQLDAGTITIEEYAQKVSDLNKIAAEFDQRGFLGIKGGIGAFLRNGTAGLAEYYRGRATVSRLKGDEEEAKRFEKLAASMEKAQQSAEDVAKAFDDIAGYADMLGNMFDAFGMSDAANAFGDASKVLGGVTSGANSLSAFGPWGMAIGALIGGATAVATVHDERLERQMEKLNDEVSDIRSNTELIKTFRDRLLGYDNGSLKWRFAAATNKGLGALSGDYDGYGKAQLAMYQYYINNSVGTGYAQELDNLMAERQKTIESLNLALKKNKATDEIDELKDKIAELDNQILYFAQDMANELWSIDLKGWADQIGDALMNAFENGENAAKAYEDTVRSIMQSVVSEVLKIGIIQPMMENLQRALFGGLDEHGNYIAGVVSTSDIVNNPQQAAEKLVLATNEYFANEGKAMITAAQEFYVGINDALEQGGLIGGLYNQDSSGSVSSSLQGMKEETADILAAYVNACRQDVAANRILLTQFVGDMWPDYIEQVSGAMASLTNIDTNVNAIRMLLSENGVLFNLIEDMKSRFDNVVNGVEGVHIY